jgi:hypothetical protein
MSVLPAKLEDGQLDTRVPEVHQNPSSLCTNALDASMNIIGV